MQLMGLAGSLLLALCALPLALEAIKTKRDVVPVDTFFYGWFGGECLLLLHVLIYVDFDLALILNYSSNVFFLLIVLYYKLFPKGK